jgi:hypothetical protein
MNSLRDLPNPAEEALPDMGRTEIPSTLRIIGIIAASAIVALPFILSGQAREWHKR